MKKILIVFGLMLGVSTLGFSAQAERRAPAKIVVPNGADVDGLEVDQDDRGQSAISISSGTLMLWSVPKSLFATLQSAVTGQMVYCRDCSAGGRTGALCMSSGTLGTDAFTLSTGTKCGAGL